MVVGKFEFNTAETRKPAETQNRLSTKSFCGSASSPRLRGVKVNLTTTHEIVLDVDGKRPYTSDARMSITTKTYEEAVCH